MEIKKEVKSGRLEQLEKELVKIEKSKVYLKKELFKINEREKVLKEKKKREKKAISLSNTVKKLRT